MKVLRLELNDGKGIYRNAEKSIWDRVVGDLEDESIHVRPHLDKKLNFDDLFDSKYVFGFKDVEQYKNWAFNPYWRKRFSELGVFLSIYEVEKRYVREGEGQLIFIKEKATLISKISPFYYK